MAQNDGVSLLVSSPLLDGDGVASIVFTGEKLYRVDVSVLGGHLKTGHQWTLQRCPPMAGFGCPPRSNSLIERISESKPLQLQNVDSRKMPEQN